MVEITEEALLNRAVTRFAMARIERLAGAVVAEIKAYPSNAMFDDNGHAETLWDDYCYDQQTGPVPFLEGVWSDLFAPHLKQIIEALDRTEATLLTFYCCWEQSDDPLEIVGNPPEGIYEDAISTAIMDEVGRLALDYQLPDEDGAGEDDDDWSEDDDSSED